MTVNTKVPTNGLVSKISFRQKKVLKKRFTEVNKYIVCRILNYVGKVKILRNARKLENFSQNF